MSVRQKVSRRSVLTAKCPHGEMSLRRSVRTAKCPYGELSYGEVSYGEKSYGEKSGNRRNIDYSISAAATLSFNCQYVYINKARRKVPLLTDSPPKDSPSKPKKIPPETSSPSKIPPRKIPTGNPSPLGKF